jgi:hypothetical protein
MPIYNGFYSGFKCRNKWNAEGTEILSAKYQEDAGDSWIILFIDLVYVAMFLNVGYLLKICGEDGGVQRMAFTIFLIMFNSREAIDEYSNRFFSNDIFHRVVCFIYTYGIFLMTLNINAVVKDTTTAHRSLATSTATDTHSELGHCEYVSEYWDGFSYGFYITRGALIILYVMVSYNNKEARAQFSSMVLRNALSLLVIVVGNLSDKTYLPVYYIAVVVETILAMSPKLLSILRKANFISFSIPDTFPLNVYDYQTRLGVFYLTVLGESIILIAEVVYDPNREKLSYFFDT